MSYGNAWTEVNLENGKVLLTGHNGTGKSSMIADSVSFALFGKPFRKINIPQLINAINQKDCQVELTFDIGNDQYQIIRGLKPSKFEIFKNGELVKQEAATKDYQLYLESQVLKISHKTFVQILVLGSAVFTPFMQLPAGARRNVIEDLLDISVFSIMMKVLKDKIQKNKEETFLIDSRIDTAKKESISQKRLINTLLSKSDDQLVQLQNELNSIDTDIKLAKVKRKDLEVQKDVICDILFDHTLYEELRVEYSTLKKDIQSSIKKSESIASIDECPTCLQAVSDSHKSAIKTELKLKYEEKKPLLDSYEAKIKELTVLKDEIDTADAHRQNLIKEILTIDTRIIALEEQQDQIKAKISLHQSNSYDDIEKEKDRLRDLAQNALKLIERKNELITEKSIQEVSLGLLKDTGIKAQIIKEYLPILNKMINKYLSEFNFFINFILDENFDEKLLSRGRDTASYYSLSEGEKKRIDVAILLAFRHIASLKNSAKINLLVLDELDSGMDYDSRLKLLELIQTMTDINVWMVSHAIQNTELEQQFDKIAYVMKKGDFSDILIK